MTVGNNQEKCRIDQLLVTKGFCESREQAQRLILAGAVRVGDRVIDKPGTRLPGDAPLQVQAGEKYVGRGGLKLEAALNQFAVSPEGRTCLDVGSSTGGFTDCLLQHGAERIFAVDVGKNQLHWKIRSDPRVVALEGCNARYLLAEDLPGEFSLGVADVSFISLTLILPPVFALLAAGGDMLVLIKPQFELSREQISRGGIVRDPSLHLEAVGKIRDFCLSSLPARWVGEMPSPILGAKGNREFLAHLQKL